MRWLYRPASARGLAIVAGLYLIYYLWWRASATLNLDALLFSLILLGAEILGGFSSLLFAFNAWNTRRKPVPPPLGVARVDFVILPGTESVENLEATLAGCAEVKPAHSTFVVVAAHRVEVEALATSFGCVYLETQRPGPGFGDLLRTALSRSRAEFVAILDGSMVPQPQILERTLGYFANERVAVVQLPSEVYRRDPVQRVNLVRERELWHEEALVDHVLQPGRNNWSAATWCGSPAVARRVVLETLEDDLPLAQTEDLLNTIRLNVEGWQTVYHHEALVFGTAPYSLEPQFARWRRWARRTFRLVFSRENPLICPGLRPPQRLCYSSAALPYFGAFQRLIYVLTPTVALMTGVLPISLSGWDFLAHWLPYFLLGNLANSALGRGYWSFFRIEQFKLLKMCSFLLAGKPSSENRRLPEPPDADDRSADVGRSGLIPTVTLLSRLFTTTLLALLCLIWGSVAISSSADTFQLTVYWLCASAVLLVITASAVLARKRRQPPPSQRYGLSLVASLTPDQGPGLWGSVQDFPHRAIGIISDRPLPSGTTVIISLYLPDDSVSMQGYVARTQPLGKGQHWLEIRLDELSLAARHQVLRHLYVTLPPYQSADHLPLSALLPAAETPDAA